MELTIKNSKVHKNSTKRHLSHMYLI